MSALLDNIDRGKTSLKSAPMFGAGSTGGSSALDDFINQYNNSYEYQGGSAGYDMSPAIRAQYQAMRDKASLRRGESETKLGELYGKLQESYKDLPQQTNQRYGAAIQGAQTGANQLMDSTRARIDSEAAQRAAAFAELGLGNNGQLSQSQGEMERGVGDVQNTAANWGGLLGAQQQSQVTRDNLNYTGAADAGTLAKEDLMRRYNAYLDNLEGQEQQALSSPGVRGGGSAGKLVNTSGISESAYNKAVEQQMINAGILPAPTSAFDEWKQKWDYQVANPKPSTSSGSTGGTSFYPR
jgi:hypothetical protein